MRPQQQSSKTGFPQTQNPQLMRVCIGTWASLPQSFVKKAESQLNVVQQRGGNMEHRWRHSSLPKTYLWPCESMKCYKLVTAHWRIAKLLYNYANHVQNVPRWGKKKDKGCEDDENKNVWRCARRSMEEKNLHSVCTWPASIKRWKQLCIKKAESTTGTIMAVLKEQNTIHTLRRCSKEKRKELGKLRKRHVV